MRLTLTTAALTLTLLAVPALAKSKDALTVPIKTSSGEDAGKATFTPGKNGELIIKVSLKNLPFGEHAVHILESIQQQ